MSISIGLDPKFRLADRELNRLGARFRLKKMMIRLHISFGHYITAPERYDRMIAFMDKNKTCKGRRF